MGRRDTAWAPSPGDVIDGRYRMRRTIDEGGMGVIFAAEHMRMRREVAIKFLHPDIGRDEKYRSRFEREVDIATSLDHTNVIQCYDFGETADGVLYLVMELLEGRSLRQFVRDEGRLSTRSATDLMLQLLDGMAAAHMAGIIHRDLKPGNVFVTTDHRGREVVKILDFGLAKSLSSDQIRLTATGSILGTASYLPPESLVVENTDEAGDVYALGLIFLELLIGRKVFASRSMAQTFVQQLVVPARIPWRIWETPLGGFLARCLAKHPAARPANADEAFHELAQVADHIDDFVLEPEEIPPRPEGNLDDGLLAELADGHYRSLDTLKTLPAPEPWVPDTARPQDIETQRIVIDALKSSGQLDVSSPDDTIPDDSSTTARPPDVEKDDKPTTPRHPDVETHERESKPTWRSPHLDMTPPPRPDEPDTRLPSRSDFMKTRERLALRPDSSSEPPTSANPIPPSSHAGASGPSSETPPKNAETPTISRKDRVLYAVAGITVLFAVIAVAFAVAKVVDQDTSRPSETKATEVADTTAPTNTPSVAVAPNQGNDDNEVTEAPGTPDAGPGPDAGDGRRSDASKASAPGTPDAGPGPDAGDGRRSDASKASAGNIATRAKSSPPRTKVKRKSKPKPKPESESESEPESKSETETESNGEQDPPATSDIKEPTQTKPSATPSNDPEENLKEDHLDEILKKHLRLPRE